MDNYNDYLDSLFQTMQEKQIGPQLCKTDEYRRLTQRQDQLLTALEAALTPAQQALLEECRNAACEVYTAEDRALFCEALQLGKWMAR